MQKTFITTVSARGQTGVPAEVRRRLGLEAQSRLLWTIDGDAVRVARVTDDPVEALWGVFKQLEEERALTSDLIQEHKQSVLDDKG